MPDVSTHLETMYLLTSEFEAHFPTCSRLSGLDFLGALQRQHCQLCCKREGIICGGCLMALLEGVEVVCCCVERFNFHCTERLFLLHLLKPPRHTCAGVPLPHPTLPAGS